jgi:hypothetical protein
MTWSLRTACLAVLYLLWLTGRTDAAVIVFSDRPSWEAAVSGAIFTETFRLERDSYDELVFPYTTAHGLTLDDVFDTGNVVAQMLPDGLVNGTVAPHFRAFSGDHMSFTLPVPVQAFGFDYFASDWDGPSTAEWQVQVGSLVTSLPQTLYDTFDFFGVVLTHPTSPLTTFTFANPGFAQGGISVDNVSYVPSSSTPIPEPSTMLLLGTSMSASVMFRVRRRIKGR